MTIIDQQETIVSLIEESLVGENCIVPDVSAHPHPLGLSVMITSQRYNFTARTFVILRNEDIIDALVEKLETVRLTNLFDYFVSSGRITSENINCLYDFVENENFFAGDGFQFSFTICDEDFDYHFVLQNENVYLLPKRNQNVADKPKMKNDEFFKTMNGYGISYEVFNKYFDDLLPRRAPVPGR